ncbi:MAG: adenylate kinase [bacterium]|nr:adenylate kinase [bacterium]
MNIIMLGPPGSGKGTQAKMLAEKLKLKHISTGDIFRKEIENSTPLGNKVKKYLDSGLLVPDELTNQIVTNGICNGFFVLDGYPRNINQAEFLDDYLKKNNMKLDFVLFLDVPDSEIIRRLTNRRICPKCASIFNLVFNRPKIDELCDNCGIKLQIREDDLSETIKKRMDVYKNETRPLLSYYKDILKRIDGVGDALTVLHNILKEINA